MCVSVRVEQGEDVQGECVRVSMRAGQEGNPQGECACAFICVQDKER